MAAEPGIVTASSPPNAVVQVHPGMNVQPVVLVDQNGNFGALVPAPTAANQYPVSNSSDAWTLSQVGTVGGNTYNAGWTLGTPDLGGEALYNSASGGTVTVPQNLTSTVGATAAFRQLGAGPLTVAAGSGVTVEGVLVTTSQYQTLFARQVTANTWAVTGSAAIGTSEAQPDGIAAPGTSGFPADLGHIHPRPGIFLPSDFGFKAWNYDPIYSNNTSTVSLSGKWFFSQAVLAQDAALSSVSWLATVAGGTPTTGENFAGIYTLSGTTATQAAVSADASSYITSTGIVTVPMSSATATIKAGTIIVIAVLINAGTSPTFARLASEIYASVVTAGSALQSRQGSYGSTGATTLPSSFSINVQQEATTILWLGAS
jgi:hypothetical protein